MAVRRRRWRDARRLRGDLMVLLRVSTAVGLAVVGESEVRRCLAGAIVGVEQRPFCFSGAFSLGANRGPLELFLAG